MQGDAGRGSGESGCCTSHWRNTAETYTGRSSAFTQPRAKPLFLNTRRNTTWAPWPTAMAPLPRVLTTRPPHLSPTDPSSETKARACSNKELLGESNLYSHYPSLSRIRDAHVELRGEGWCYAVWVFPCLLAYQRGSLGCKGWKRYNKLRVFNSRSFWTLFLAEKESRGEKN